MKHRSKKILSYIITIAVIAAAAIWVGSRFVHLGNVEFTDNAQVRQQIVPVNSRVQGYIKEIRFSEYEPVKKGDTLVIIDDADMRLNVARARADWQNALAGRDVADRSVASASANVAVSEASIAEAKVLMKWLPQTLPVMRSCWHRMPSHVSNMTGQRRIMRRKKPAMKCCRANARQLRR